jgi:4-carboxymuconolactone decarboxylase
VLGSARFQQTVGSATPFDRDFQDFISEYCWGGSWGRGVLPDRQRSMLTLAMLACLGRSAEFEAHFRGALVNVGISPRELREVLFHVAIYGGVPAAVESFRIGRRVLQEEGIDLSELERPETVESDTDPASKAGMSRAQPIVHVENDVVRVTEWRFGPGAATGFHRHETDYVIVPLADFSVRIVAGDGSEQLADMNRGIAYFRRAGVEHDVLNATERDVAFVEIELKGRPG